VRSSDGVDCTLGLSWRALEPQLPAQNEGDDWGRIIFISSESAINIPVEMIQYGVTKTQLALARGLAKTTAGTGHVCSRTVDFWQAFPFSSNQRSTAAFFSWHEFGEVQNQNGMNRPSCDKPFEVREMLGQAMQRNITENLTDR